MEGVLLIIIVIATIALPIFWVYVLVSVLMNEFKDQTNKVIWLILILVFPFSRKFICLR